MSQTVARLKELLFDSEAQALENLSRRIDSVAAADETARTEIKNEIAGVIERAGTTERFTASVSEVLNDALQRAEVESHTDLSNTIAPLVVTTIKTELRNSQDEMVEALYPITGRLVKAYVASAIKDLTEDMNRRLEQNAVMLRLQSLATGRSVAELALAGTQDFAVEELFLIRRGSGELIAHWPEVSGNGREQLMSGVLAAVNAVANEAFAADDSSLRQIELNESTVYLRGSPLYLLAAKCSGVAPKGAEQLLDEAFLDAVEKQHNAEALPADEASAWHKRLIGDLGQDLRDRIAEQKSAIARPAGNPLKTLAILILLPIIGYLGWTWANAFANNRTRETAERVIMATAAMQGYPARLNVANFGRTLTVSGLAPSAAVKEKVLSRLTLVLPRTAIQDELTVVPGSDITVPDLSPEIDKVRTRVVEVESELKLAALRRLGERAARRLSAAGQDLSRAAAADTNKARAKALEESAVSVAALTKDVASAAGTIAKRSAAGDETTAQTTAVLTALAERTGRTLNGVLAALGESPDDSNVPRPSADAGAPDIAAEALASGAERLGAVASAALLAARLTPEPPPPPPPPPQIPKPSARDLLKEAASRSAVFFSNGAEYRDASAAARTLDALVPLLKDAKTLLRVVGYTDVAGTAPGNVTLAGERAEKVRQDLIARGAPASFVTSVGRAEAKDLSGGQGPDSPNRRVEFEIGFDGEILQ